MSRPNSIDGELTVDQAKIAIVVGRFNSFIVDSLLNGALDILRRAGIADGDITVSPDGLVEWGFTLPGDCLIGVRAEDSEGAGNR